MTARRRSRPAAAPARTAGTMDDVREHLMSWPTRELVGLIVRWADEDDRLRDGLQMQVAARLAEGPDLAAFRAALRDALKVDPGAPWHDSGDWTRGAGMVVDSIQELLEQGHVGMVVDLCEEALERLDDVSGLVDDSEGEVTSLAERLGELHLEACRTGAIDPAELGRRLVELELGAQHEAFYGAIDSYREVLGEPGVASYRGAVERLWARLHPLGPGDSDEEYDDRRWRLTHMMERATELTGTVDDLVAVMSRDLSASHDFLKIAEALREAGRFDDALAWAERGLAAFADRPDSRLREFAANEHHRAGRHDTAMAVMWTAFEERPGLERYRHLFEHAGAAGIDWAPWNDRALAFLRADIERGRGAGRKRHVWEPVPDRSSLVEIFLWRNDVESAWREACEGGCRDELWGQLARLRQDDHPEDAVPIYRREIDRLVGRKNNRSYEEAVTLLRRVRAAMSRMEPSGDFWAYVAALRAEHRQKRNFMALLDRARW